MQLPCSRLDQTSVRLEHFASSVSRPMSASLETFPRHSRVQKAPTAGKRRDLNLEPRLVHLGQFVLLDHRGRHQRRKASSPSVLEWPRGSLAFQEHMLQTMPLFGAGTALPDFHARMMGQCFQLRGPPGTYREATDGIACALCPEGTWTPSSGVSSRDLCEPCPSGLVCAVDGMSSLELASPCPEGLFATLQI